MTHASDSASDPDRRGASDAPAAHGNKIAKLIRMANQIGEFHAALPEAEGIEGTAKHLRLYWTPKMIRELAAVARRGGEGLNPTARRAIESLKLHG